MTSNAGRKQRDFVVERPRGNLRRAAGDEQPANDEREQQAHRFTTDEADRLDVAPHDVDRADQAGEDAAAGKEQQHQRHDAAGAGQLDLLLDDPLDQLAFRRQVGDYLLGNHLLRLLAAEDGRCDG
jgi:hypothetical protein